MRRKLVHSEKYIIYITVIGVISTILVIGTTKYQVWHHLPYSQYDTQARDLLQLRRVQQIEKACSYLRSRVQQVQYKQIENQAQIYTTRNFSICVVPKSGCSFLKQTVFYLSDPTYMSNFTLDISIPKHILTAQIQALQRMVFQLPRWDIHHAIDFRPLKISLDRFKNANSLKVIVARNPYSRLFSAYMDKVYIPVLPSYIYKQQRFSTDQILSKTQICSSQHVSFEEFLKITVRLSRYSSGNEHWLPVSSLCDPCHVKPDLVIKQESYSEDVMQFLTKINLNHTEWETINNAMMKHGVQPDSYLRGLIETMYYIGLTRSRDCFSKIQIAQRVWKALQVQGQIYQYLNFPYKKLKLTGNFTSTTVADIFMEEIKTLPITPEESKNQRQHQLAIAYRNIKPQVLFDIQAMYYYDFILFGYDQNPPK